MCLRLYHVTSILHCHESRYNFVYIYLYLKRKHELQSSILQELNIYKAPLGCRRFQIGCVFADLGFLYKILYIHFCFTVLYKFLKTGTSDRTLVGLCQLVKCLGFSLDPLSFFLYSPFTGSVCPN